jgi:hypothetical protein
MEYFLGSFLTLAVIVCCNLMLKSKNNKPVTLSVKINQSRLHELIKPIVFLENLRKSFIEKQPSTQSKKHYSSQHVRVIMSETEAYWIANNKFYVAEVVNSLVVQETTREVDTMVMDDVQLNKIMKIVEMLGEGNDSSGPGNKSF